MTVHAGVLRLSNLKSGAPPLDDDEAIRRAKTGDSRAAELLVVKYQRDVYNTCLRFLRHPADAEDAAQEALVSALTHLDGFRLGASFGAWLGGIARHRSLDRIRSRDRSWTAEIAEMPGESADVEEQALAGIDAAAVREALDTLPEMQRALLVMRYWEDLSSADIATQLGMTEGAVRVAMLRARRELASRLAGVLA